MSGIIGSTGSKSGVIGTTELDYEEGTLDNALKVGGTTVNTNTGSTWGAYDYRYVKVGNFVTARFFCDTNNANLGATGAISFSLPFTVASGFLREYNIGKNYYGTWSEDFSYLGENMTAVSIFKFEIGDNFNARTIASATDRIHLSVTVNYWII